MQSNQNQQPTQPQQQPTQPQQQPTQPQNPPQPQQAQQNQNNQPQAQNQNQGPPGFPFPNLSNLASLFGRGGQSQGGANQQINQNLSDFFSNMPNIEIRMSPNNQPGQS